MIVRSFCREVVKPNDAFNLEYETSGNYEQSQIEMSSIAYGPINESMNLLETFQKKILFQKPKSLMICIGIFLNFSLNLMK